MIVFRRIQKFNFLYPTLQKSFKLTTVWCKLFKRIMNGLFSPSIFDLGQHDTFVLGINLFCIIRIYFPCFKILHIYFPCSNNLKVEQRMRHLPILHYERVRCPFFFSFSNEWMIMSIFQILGNLPISRKSILVFLVGASWKSTRHRYIPLSSGLKGSILRVEAITLAPVSEYIPVFPNWKWALEPTVLLAYQCRPPPSRMS